jgi:hypothetical protein
MSSSRRSSDRNRDRMAVVGPASRLAIERALMDDGFTLREARLLLSGLCKTTTYSRLSDHVYLAELVDLARVERRQARRALASLGARGSLFWKGGSGRRRSWLGLPGADPQLPLIAVASSKGDATIPLSGTSKGDATIPREEDATIPLRGGHHDPPVQVVLPESLSTDERSPDGTCGWGKCCRCPHVGDVRWFAGQTWCESHYREEAAA